MSKLMDKSRYALSEYVRFVPRHDGMAVYHSLLGGLCFVDSTVTKLLEGFRGGSLAVDAITPLPFTARRQGEILVDIFAAKGFLITPGDDEYTRVSQGITARLSEGMARGAHLGVVQLVVTNRCNYCCTYCFIDKEFVSKTRNDVMQTSEGAMMSPSTAGFALDRVISLLQENDNSQLAVQFFGGEPLLNQKTIQFVLEHYGWGERHGVVINYSIVTNGSLITEKIAELFARYGVTVIVSLDSMSYKNDQRRTAKGESGAIQVVKNLKLLHNLGVTVILNTVLSEETFAGFNASFAVQAADIGIGEIGILLDLNPDFYIHHPAEEIVDRVWAFYKQGKERGVAVTGYWHTTFQRMFQFNQLERVGYKSCSATGCQLSIEPDGAVFACKASASHLGHINDLKGLVAGESYRFYAMRAMRNAPDCKGCEIENFCSGLCLGAVEKKYGNPYSIEKSACATYRLLARRLIADVNPAGMERYGIYIPDLQEMNYPGVKP